MTHEIDKHNSNGDRDDGYYAKQRKLNELVYAAQELLRVDSIHDHLGNECRIGATPKVVLGIGRWMQHPDIGATFVRTSVFVAANLVGVDESDPDNPTLILDDYECGDMDDESSVEFFGGQQRQSLLTVEYIHALTDADN